MLNIWSKFFDDDCNEQRKIKSIKSSSINTTILKEILEKVTPMGKQNAELLSELASSKFALVHKENENRILREELIQAQATNHKLFQIANLMKTPPHTGHFSSCSYWVAYELCYEESPFGGIGAVTTIQLMSANRLEKSAENSFNRNTLKLVEIFSNPGTYVLIQNVPVGVGCERIFSLSPPKSRIRVGMI